jgi:hypothetical protein
VVSDNEKGAHDIDVDASGWMDVEVQAEQMRERIVRCGQGIGFEMNTKGRGGIDLQRLKSV